MAEFDANLISYIKWAELQADPASKVYYYNKEDKTTQWNKPPEYVIWFNEVCNKYLKSIASSWRQYTDKKGKVYYANKATSATAWSVPAELDHFADFKKFALKLNSKLQTTGGTSDGVAAEVSAGPETKKRKLDDVEGADESQQPVERAMRPSGLAEVTPAVEVAPSILSPSGAVDHVNAEAMEVEQTKAKPQLLERKEKGPQAEQVELEELAALREVWRPAAEMDLETVGAYLGRADAVLDAGVLAYVERFLQLSGGASVDDSGLSASLSDQYVGGATLCKVVALWSGMLRSYERGGDPNAHQNDVLFEFLCRVVKGKFDPSVADRVIKGLDRGAQAVPDWLEAMLSSEKYRRLLLELFVSDSVRDEFELQRPGSALLEQCVALMLTRGYVLEVCAVLPVGEIRSVRLCREMVHALVLQQVVTAPASGADSATATSALNLCRLVASSAACFVYAMELVHALLEKYAPAASTSAPALSVVYRLHRVRDTVQSATFIDDWKLCHGDNVGEALGALASESRAKAVGATTLAWWLQSRAAAAASPEAAQIQKLVLVVAKKRSVSDAQVAELHGLAQQLSAPGSGAFVAECLHLEPVAGVLVRRFMRHGGASSEDVAAQQLCTVIAAAYCHPCSALVPAGASAGCLQSEVEELLSATRAQCHELVNIVSTSMGTVHHVTTAIANKLHVATQDLLEGRLEVAVVSHCILEWIAANAQATTDRKAFSVGCFHALLQAYLSLVLGIFSTSGPLLQLECVSLLQLVLSPALAGELSASASMPHESEDLVRHCLTTLVHMLGLAGRQLGGGDAFVIERIFALIRSKLVLVEPDMVRYFFRQFVGNLQPPFASSYQSNLCQLLLLPQSHSALVKTLSISQTTRAALLFAEQFRDVAQWLQHSLAEGANSKEAAAELQAVLKKYGRLVSLQ